MPRKRQLGALGAVEHSPVPHLPVVVAELPQVTQEWLQVTGQALPVSTQGLDALERLCQPDQGRYSVNRAADGRIYHKWAYGEGKWRGHYVMYVGAREESVLATFRGLLDKMDDVAAGRLKPARDPYYKGR